MGGNSMVKHFKGPLSILLAVMMVIGIFSAVPTTVSARTVTETGSEVINTNTINASTYYSYDYTGSRFYVRAITDYCDSDGFNLGNSNSAAVMSFNGETITKLVPTIGKIEKDIAPY